jgi:hypothetical protein
MIEPQGSDDLRTILFLLERETQRVDEIVATLISDHLWEGSYEGAYVKLRIRRRLTRTSLFSEVRSQDRIRFSGEVVLSSPDLTSPFDALRMYVAAALAAAVSSPALTESDGEEPLSSPTTLVQEKGRLSGRIRWPFRR